MKGRGGKCLTRERKGRPSPASGPGNRGVFCAALGRGGEGGFILWMQQSFSPWRCGVASESPTAPSVLPSFFHDGQYSCFLPATLGHVWP